jgi:cyclohexanone monooxygenase
VNEPANQASSATPTVAILGAGAGGMCMAIRLKNAGIHSFTIYERSDGFGGTWRLNTYPGAQCDVKSHFYSFSFALKADWSRAYAEQPEILEYLEGIADRFGLRPHLRPNTSILETNWDDDRARWQLRSDTGEQFEADIVVSGLGVFTEPKYLDVPGLEDFEGTWFHSSRWDHNQDLAGKRIALIGTGASSVQILPKIAPAAEQLYLYQRQPGWILPKSDLPYTERQKWTFAHIPGAGRLHRAKVWYNMERVLAVRPRGTQHEKKMEMGRQHLRAQVADPELRAKLEPDYPIGCKRLLPSNDWFPTLQEPNVELVTDRIERFTPKGILTSSGEEHQVDVIVFATGFSATKYLSALEVTGVGGLRLHDEWSDGAEAYLGMTVAGFPNFFLLYGPNTNGTQSVIYMIEAQVHYIMTAIARIRRHHYASMEVRRGAMEHYNDKIQASMGDTVWASGCNTYFVDENGKVRTQIPYRAHWYWLRTKVVRPDHYIWRRLSARAGGSAERSATAEAPPKATAGR